MNRLAGGLLLLLCLTLPALAIDLRPPAIPLVQPLLNGTQVCLDEEFLNPASSSADTNWLLRNITGTGSFASVAGTYPHIGVARVTTAVADASTEGYGLDAASAGLGNLAANTNWEVYATFALGRATTVSFRVGLAQNAATITPTDALILRFDTALTDTNFMFCRRAASDVENCISSGIAGDTAWHTLHITSTTAGTVNFSLDGAASLCFTSAVSGCTSNSNTMPSAAMSPAWVVRTVSGGAVTFDMDRFAFCAYGLSR
jgi:hypothetical protein